MLPHPAVRTMNKHEWATWNHVDYAYYDSLSNELVLTPKLCEQNAVEAIVHEMTHWAEYMALTPEERGWEADIYSKLCWERSPEWMQSHHVCERLAYWMEEG